MFRGFRLVVSVTAALPINTNDGEAVYNFRGSVSTGHFLGQLFRTLGQVLNLQPDNQQIEDIIRQQTSDSATLHSPTEEQFRVESRISGNQEVVTKNEVDDDDLRRQVGGEVKPPFCRQESKEVKSKVHKKDDKWYSPSQEKEDVNNLKREKPTCQNLSQGKICVCKK